MADQEAKTAGREPLTPANEKRLQKLFEIATKKAALATEAEDFNYIADLFSQCVLGNPRNLEYVRGYVENLQKKYGNNRKGGWGSQFKERGSRNALKKALAQEHWDEVIEHGLKVLAVNPWDVPTLTGMATAAVKSGDRECQLFYLKCAQVASPKDPVINRLCAIALTEWGIFDQAIACWHRVEEALPNDQEAKSAISIIMHDRIRARSGYSDDDGPRRPQAKGQEQAEDTPERKLQRAIENEPGNLANYTELAQLHLTAERYDEAEDVLAKAFEVSDGDIDMRERWEDAQLRHMRQKIGRAHDPATRAKLQHEYYEKDLEVCKNRVARYPGNLSFKFDLGYRYLLTGHYKQAIQELQAARNDPRKKGLSLLALGQCFQKIKQYRMALKHYEAAIHEIPDRDADSKKRALYLAGLLAMSRHLNDIDSAEKHLTTLASLDFTYKDVSALLDKIANLRDNPESVGGKPAEDTSPETGDEPASPPAGEQHPTAGN